MHAERRSRASVLLGWRQVLKHKKHKRFCWRRDWEIWKFSPPQVLCEVLLKRMRMVAMQEKHKCFTILAAEEEEESAPPPSRFIASYFFASHNQPSSIASVWLSSAHPTRQAKQASKQSIAPSLNCLCQNNSSSSSNCRRTDQAHHHLHQQMDRPSTFFPQSLLRSQNRACLSTQL